MPHLFGYGSLLNLSSASRSLHRQITLDDLVPATLHGYRRTWTAPAAIQLSAEPQGPIRDALFLDLSTSESTCNGVVVQISDAELQEMDLREKNYERTNVHISMESEEWTAVTYVVPKKQKTNEGVVLREYWRMLDDALSDFGSMFRQEFWATTDDPPLGMLDGNYTFADAIQNKAAGR